MTGSMRTIATSMVSVATWLVSLATTPNEAGAKPRLQHPAKVRRGHAARLIAFATPVCSGFGPASTIFWASSASSLVWSVRV